MKMYIPGTYRLRTSDIVPGCLLLYTGLVLSVTLGWRRSDTKMFVLSVDYNARGFLGNAVSVEYIDQFARIRKVTIDLMNIDDYEFL